MTDISVDFVGNALLWGATIGSFLGAFLSFLHKHELARRLIFLISVVLLTASAYLVIQFLNDNFSFLYVAQNSNVLLPVYYKISAFWGAHEGSFLLMIVLLSLSITFSNYFIRNKNQIMQSNFMHYQFSFCIYYLLSQLLILFTSSLILQSMEQT